MAKRLTIIIISLISAIMLHAQADGNVAQYYAAPTFFNPAATGTTDFIRIRGGARMQWVGIDGAPRTFMGAADMPVKLGAQRIGVGVVLNQESIGLYKTLDLGAQIAYKLKKWGGVWGIGLQPSYFDQSFKGSEVYLPSDDDYHQGTDEAIPTNDIHGSTFDLAAGFWYEHPKFYAGLSCAHILKPTITLNAEDSAGGSETSATKYQFEASPTLYFTAGCNIPVKNTLFEIMPSVLVKSTFTFTSGELTARARYNKFLSFGLGYRWDDALIATIGAEIKNFYLGYSYEYATSAIHSASSGSHEVWVGYSMKLDLNDKNKNRHKSVRIL